MTDSKKDKRGFWSRVLGKIAVSPIDDILVAGLAASAGGDLKPSAETVLQKPKDVTPKSPVDLREKSGMKNRTEEKISSPPPDRDEPNYEIAEVGEGAEKIYVVKLKK